MRDNYKQIVRNLLRDEIIGLFAFVEKSPNKSEQGIEGNVVDETRNTFKIRNKKEEIKTIQKSGRIFIIHYQGLKIRIKGDLFVGRPEERIKKNVRKIVR